MKDAQKEKNQGTLYPYFARDNPPKQFKTFDAVQYFPQTYSTPEKVEPSTDFCRIKHSFTDSRTQSPYYLNSKLLDLCDFGSHVRQRMICWLMQQSSKRHLQRQTCAKSIALMDLYFMKNGVVTLAHIQQLGIACLNMACKFSQRLIHPIQSNPQVFSQQRILNFEIQILKRTNFRINPPTYADIAQHLITRWDQYIKNLIISKSNSSFRNCNCIFFTDKQLTQSSCSHSWKMFNIVTQLYELLDCLTAIKQMLDYDIQDLVYNSFFIFLKSRADMFDKTNMPNIQLQIRQILKDIYRGVVIEIQLKSQQRSILLDESLQKLISIPLCRLQKIRQQNPNFGGQSSLQQMIKKFPQSSLAQLSTIQTWKPYYLKVVKQSSNKIKQVQQSFQI